LQVPSPQELQAVQQSLQQQGREPLQVGTPIPLGQQGLQQQANQQATQRQQQAQNAMAGQAPGRMGSLGALAAFRQAQQGNGQQQAAGPTTAEQAGQDAMSNGFGGNTPYHIKERYGSVASPAASRGETITDAAATPPPALQQLPAAATATPPRMVQTGTNSRGKPMYGPAETNPYQGSAVPAMQQPSFEQNYLTQYYNDGGGGSGGGDYGGGGYYGGGVVRNRR